MKRSNQASDLLSRISLFVPFYTPKDPDRAAELLNCLRRNLDCSAINHVYLLQDDDTPLPFPDPHLTVLKVDTRPTYLDWVRYSKKLCPDHISVLANSDIYFESDVTKLHTIFEAVPNAFVALSRYDLIGPNIVPHANPHWSQDTWVFPPNPDIPPEMEQQLDIPLGIPRCDNKIAYVCSLNGYSVVNPFHDIHSIHVHETGLRYYDKKGDTKIKGGMAMVHPSPSLTAPAPLDVEIWSLNSTQYAPPRINPSLEHWRKERQNEAQAKQRIFVYDHDWQYPAITEKHAYDQMQREFDAGNALSQDTAYLAFPWATLIDLSTHAKHRTDKINALTQVLAELSQKLSSYKRIVTVCQHIRMRQFSDLFAKAGVTDIFWTHCELNQSVMPEHPKIALHAFPLYPVQQVPIEYTDIHAPRPLLYSFVGAKSSKIYLTQSRTMILDELKSDPRGKIIDRDNWHYNKIVYDKQILDRATPASGALEDDSAALQFRKIMSETTFTLCPSGTGPNSIRLWEAALNGSIPVVLSDRYQPPRDKALWSLATLSCSETPEAIRALPARLVALQANKGLLRRKKLALYLMCQQYGPAKFVHDIMTLFEQKG